MSPVIRVVVLVQKGIGSSARVRQQGVESLVLDLRIARHRACLADEGRHFVALDPLDHIRRGCRREQLRLGQRVAQLVNLDDVRNFSCVPTGWPRGLATAGSFLGDTLGGTLSRAWR